MTSFQGIKEATKNIKEKKKIEKIKFGDIPSSQPVAREENILNVKTSKDEDNKTTGSKPVKTTNIQTTKTSDRRSANKHQITAYLLDSELEMLEELYFIRRKKKIKIDKSALIGEAIELLYRKTV